MLEAAEAMEEGTRPVQEPLMTHEVRGYAALYWPTNTAKLPLQRPANLVEVVSAWNELL
jgi:hypothetical protein